MKSLLSWLLCPHRQEQPTRLVLTLDSQNTTYHKDSQIRPYRTGPEPLRDLLQIVVGVPGLMDRALVRRCQGGGGQEESVVHPEDTKPKRGRGPPFGLYPGPGKGSESDRLTRPGHKTPAPSIGPPQKKLRASRTPNRKGEVGAEVIYIGIMTACLLK